MLYIKPAVYIWFANWCSQGSSLHWCTQNIHE